MALWTPALITTAIWLDAADSATVSVSGSDVLSWLDKSGNSRHATSGIGARPIGNPASDGQVLSSTTAGVRSWVAPSSGGALDMGTF